MITIKSLKKMHIAHFVIIICFVTYLFSADLIFDRWLKVKGEAQMINLDLPEESEKSKLSFGLDHIENTKIKWKELGKIEGWAFINGLSAESAKIFIVLASKSQTYIFDSEKVLRGDIPLTFNNDNLYLENSGFISFFPKEMLEDGVYNLGIHIKNDNTSSFNYTDEYITKKEHKVFRGFLSDLLPIKLTPATKTILSNIELIKSDRSVDEDIIKIRGWAFIDGQNAAPHSIFVILSSDKNTYTFNTVLQKRPDVTYYYHSKQRLNVDNSGFLAHIPKRLLEDGLYTLGIQMENDNGTAFQYLNEYLTKIKQTVYKGFLSSEQKIALIPETDNIFTSIESISETKEHAADVFEIKGYAFITGMNSGNNSIYIVLRSRDRTYVFDTASIKRADVTRCFHNLGLTLDNSGFAGHISKKIIQKGSYRIGIYIENGDHRELKFTDISLAF